MSSMSLANDREDGVSSHAILTHCMTDENTREVDIKINHSVVCGALGGTFVRREAVIKIVVFLLNQWKSNRSLRFIYTSASRVCCVLRVSVRQLTV